MFPVLFDSPLPFFLLALPFSAFLIQTFPAVIAPLFKLAKVPFCTYFTITATNNQKHDKYIMHDK